MSIQQVMGVKNIGAGIPLPATGERVLVVAAHPDDETLGCGATIARHAKSNDVVMVAVMSDGVGSRGIVADDVQRRRGEFIKATSILGVKETAYGEYPDNQMDTVAQLAIAKDIEEVIARFKPTTVYTHWHGDLNIDHRIVCAAVSVACRPVAGSTVKRLLFFEVPSSTEWQTSHFSFTPNYFVDITDTMDLKLSAMEAYASEVREYPHPRSIQSIKALAQYRGSSCGVHEAEAFVLARGLK